MLNNLVKRPFGPNYFHSDTKSNKALKQYNIGLWIRSDRMDDQSQKDKVKMDYNTFFCALRYPYVQIHIYLYELESDLPVQEWGIHPIKLERHDRYYLRSTATVEAGQSITWIVPRKGTER